MDKTAKIIFGGIVAGISGFIGGMDGIMYALLMFVSADYITGAAAAAKEKRLSSEVGFWGLVRKVCIFLLVGVGHYLDRYVLCTGDAFRTAAALYYIGNEGVSLIENCAALGLPVPDKIKDVLCQIKGDEDR